MSRAFVREDDADVSADELPAPADDDVPNWITPGGLRRLEEKLRQLEDERAPLSETVDDRPRAAALDRDLRHLRRRLHRARVVDPAQQPPGEVRFGAEVDTEDENGEKHRFRIVGEDEADIARGRVSWRSPLARALTGAKIGDTARWERPVGDLELEVIDIRYPED